MGLAGLSRRNGRDDGRHRAVRCNRQACGPIRPYEPVVRRCLYAAVRQDAFVVPPPFNASDPLSMRWGRYGLESYLKHGYVPFDVNMTTGPASETVSRTMNYALSDFSISQAAAALGHADDAAVLLNRSYGYRQLFDKQTGFFRSKAANGSFHAEFDQFAWGNDYTEAGPWQYRFYAPHDVQGWPLCACMASSRSCPRVELQSRLPGSRRYLAVSAGSNLNRPGTPLTRVLDVS